MSRSWMIGGIIAVLGAAAIAFCSMLISAFTGNVSDPGERFVAAAAAGDENAAYAEFSTSLKSHISPKELKTILENTGLYGRPATFNFDRWFVQNGIGHLEGTVAREDGEELELIYELTRENGIWRIDLFEYGPPPDTLYRVAHQFSEAVRKGDIEGVMSLYAAGLAKKEPADRTEEILTQLGIFGLEGRTKFTRHTTSNGTATVIGMFNDERGLKAELQVSLVEGPPGEWKIIGYTYTAKKESL